MLNQDRFCDVGETNVFRPSILDAAGLRWAERSDPIRAAATPGTWWRVGLPMATKTLLEARGSASHNRPFNGIRWTSIPASSCLARSRQGDDPARSLGPTSPRRVPPSGSSQLAFVVQPVQGVSIVSDPPL